MLDYADLVCINKFDKAGALDALADVRKQFKRKITRKRQIGRLSIEQLINALTKHRKTKDPESACLVGKMFPPSVGFVCAPGCRPIVHLGPKPDSR